MDVTDAERYPGTSVFVNLLGLRDPKRLDVAEAFLSARRDQEFYANPGTVVVSQSSRFSLNHLCAIHRHQFQDVYSWAGVCRSFSMRKGFHREFSLPVDIEQFASSVHHDIGNDSSLFSGNIGEASKGSLTICA